MKKIIAATFTAVTFGSTANAQQAATPAAIATDQPASSSADATVVGPGFSMGKTANTALKLVEIKDADIVTSKLVGMNIYSKENEEVGEISDIVVGDGKSVIGMIASVGGFLGLGSSYVVIDPASLAIADDKGTWKAYVDTTKDALTAAPKFDYDRMER